MRDLQPIAKCSRLGLRPLRRTSRGSAIVEFALGSGVLLAAFAGCFQIGYTLIQYDRLQTAVAQAARYASIAPYDSATATPSSSFQSAVQNMVLYASPAVGGSPVVSGLKAANIQLVVTFNNGVPGTMKVSITGYSINALFGVHTLNGKPQATYSYQGIWSPV
jgi:Flp pilus assembly protein TadG